jgi:hypothetical protein
VAVGPGHGVVAAVMEVVRTVDTRARLSLSVQLPDG